MAPVSTQKWELGIFPGGKGGRCVKLTTLPHYVTTVLKSRRLKLLEPSGPIRACNGIALPLHFVVAGKMLFDVSLCKCLMNSIWWRRHAWKQEARHSNLTKQIRWSQCRWHFAPCRLVNSYRHF